MELGLLKLLYLGVEILSVGLAKGLLTFFCPDFRRLWLAVLDLRLVENLSFLLGLYFLAATLFLDTLEEFLFLKGVNGFFNEFFASGLKVHNFVAG
jgi:hypothetical protein